MIIGLISCGGGGGGSTPEPTPTPTPTPTPQLQINTTNAGAISGNIITTIGLLTEPKYR